MKTHNQIPSQNKLVLLRKTFFFSKKKTSTGEIKKFTRRNSVGLLLQTCRMNTLDGKRQNGSK